MNRFPNAFRAVVPRAVRRRLSDVMSDRTSHRTHASLEALGRSDRPVIVGPWVGEVGFELLYWIPFLHWALSVAQIDRSRLIVISRGGTASWYAHIGGRYADVFDFLRPDEFHTRNCERHREVGEQKQVRPTRLETDIVDRVTGELRIERPHVLHPGMMYELLNPYWWGHRTVQWVEQHARFQPLAVDSSVSLPNVHRNYAAVKFYFNECFPATRENRALAARIVREMADEGPVISLATGLRLDDHDGWEEEERIALNGIRDVVTPATNLAFQTRLVAGARAWAGTYGGFAYLAPFHNVPARAFYSDPAGFSRRHLDLAQQVFSRFGRNLLQLTNVQ